MNRPYCSEELRDLNSEIHARHKLSDVFAVHRPCLHRYRVKKGGRKEQFILEAARETIDDQTCSVCFKLRTSLKKPSTEDIELIRINDGNDEYQLNEIFLSVKNEFYRWLFQHDF